jgi:hypothetical protein
MGSHMKTTIDIADGLLAEAKKLAERRRVTVRSLVEKGLRQVLEDQRRAAPAFKLRDASVKGRGLWPELKGKSWAEIRDMAYEGRGA